MADKGTYGTHKATEHGSAIKTKLKHTGNMGRPSSTIPSGFQTLGDKPMDKGKFDCPVSDTQPVHPRNKLKQSQGPMRIGGIIDSKLRKPK